MKYKFSLLSLILFASSGASDTLPNPWYQDNLENYISGIMIDDERGGSIGFLRNNKLGASSGNVIQHSSPKKEWLGKRIRLTAKVKTNSVDSARLFMIITHNNSQRTSDQMIDRKIKGSTDWKEYSIVLDFTEDPDQELMFGITLEGDGEVFFDDFTFSEVSREIDVTGEFTRKKRREEPYGLHF